jgi:hypothetical protein
MGEPCEARRQDLREQFELNGGSLAEDPSGTVFISYTTESSDHIQAVLTLSARLRSEGIDCVLDQYVSCPPEGWPRWMDREIRKAQFVLMICTKEYYSRVMWEDPPVGLGIAWEGSLIYNHIYGAGSQNTKFIPVIFDPEHAKFIPTPLQGAPRYCVSTNDGYEELYRRLLGRPPAEKPPLGKRKPLQERGVKTNLAKLLFPIDPALWDKANWHSTVFALARDGQPPYLGFGFANEDAARQIFRDWLEQFGPRDEFEELRVSIIEGDIPGQEPGYTVRVGLDIQNAVQRYKKSGLMPDGTWFVTLSRSNRMVPGPNSPQPARFRDMYRAYKTYFLAPAIVDDARKDVKIITDMRIQKSKIYFRHVSEIGKDDEDIAVLRTPKARP